MTDPRQAADNMGDARGARPPVARPAGDQARNSAPPLPARKMAAPLGVYYPQAEERERERLLRAIERANKTPVPLRTRLRQLRQNVPLMHQALLVVAIVALFWRTLFIYFVGDDFGLLRRAQDNFTQPGAWVSAFTHVSFLNTYRPLSQQVFFWLGLHLFGLHPSRYHFVQLAAYLVTALLLYRLLVRLTGAPWISLAATALWAFSLTHFDALGWISAITETSALLFAVLSLLAFAADHPRRAVAWYVLGLLCDESVIVLPAMAIAYLLLRRRAGVREAIKGTLGYWVVFVIYAALRLTMIGLATQSTSALTLSPLALLGLLWQSATWSVGATPVLPFLEQVGSPGWRVVVTLVFVVSVLSLALAPIAFAVRAWRQRALDTEARDALRLVILGAVWFVLGLAPVIIYAGNPFAEYNLSLGLIGGAVVLAGCLRGTQRRLRVPLAAGITVAFLALNLVLMYAPAGQLQDDTIGVLANAAYGANQEMLAAERQHPGPLYIHVTGDATSAPYLTYVLYGNDAADLVAPGSIVCYTATCSVPINLTLHFDGATWSFEVVSSR